MTQQAANHPEPGALAAFVEGNVSGEELSNMIAHVRNCLDCRSIIRMGAQFQREDEGVVTPSPKQFARSLVAASLIVVTAAGIALYHRRMDPLRSLQGERRAIEGRLTGFEYAPFEAPKRSGGGGLKLEALVELQKRVKSDRTAFNLHRLALGELAIGHVADAQKLLSEAVSLDRTNAAFLSDLAAAQLAMNQTAEAAETSARALEHDPDLATARFNWALALESICVRPSAIAAWNEYLRRDPAGEWSDEVRTRKVRIEHSWISWDEDKVRLTRGVDAGALRAIVDRHSQQARAWVLRELLPQWIREGRKVDYDLALAIGRVRASIGDRYILDIIEHAARDDDPRLREGIRLFGIASEHLRARQTDIAGDIYAKAADLLHASASPLALSADVAVASTDFYGGRTDAALIQLDRVVATLQGGGDRYPIVAAEEAWIRGLVWSRRDADASLNAYNRGLAAARHGSDPELEAILAALIAEVVDRVGDPAEADRKRAQALRLLDGVAAAPDRLYAAFSSSAYASLRAKRPHLAVAFIDAQRSLAGNDPLLLAESDAANALALRDLGQFHEAAKYVRAARAHLRGIATKGLRDRTESNLEFIAGTIDAQGNPAAATVSLTNAIRIWSEYGWHVHNATAYLVRGEAQVALGDRTAAEADFRAGIAEMEHQREGLTEPRLREAYFERADRLFDRLVELLIDQARFDDALTIAERKRARELLHAVAANGPIGTAEPLDATALAAAVEGSTAVIEYMLLDRGVAMWVIRNGQTAFIRRETPRAQIEGLIRSHLAAIATDDLAATKRLGRSLYDELIAPASMYLRDSRNVVIIGDGDLQIMPFAALVGPDRRYLIEELPLAFSPSASVFVRNARPVTGGGNVLVVAQPNPAGMEFLPNAELEAKEVAAVYGVEHVLVGADVSPEEFLVRSGRATLVHFSGHALLEEHEPSASSLVFESSSNRPPLLLRAGKVAAARLPSRPLVVVAGCSSGRGPLKQTEGVDSLAAAFLRAGAHGVVATLWDIDDQASSRLLLSFHRQLERGATATEALRDAQLAMLASKEPNDRRPETWAGFVVLGTL